MVAAQIVLVAAHVVGLLVLVVDVLQLAAVCPGEGAAAAAVAGLPAAVLPVVPQDPTGDHQYHHQRDQQDEKGDVVFPLCEMKDMEFKHLF